MNNEVIVGAVTEEQKQQLMDLLDEYRDCFPVPNNELGFAKST